MGVANQCACPLWPSLWLWKPYRWLVCSSDCESSSGSVLHLWLCAVTQVGVRRLSFTTHRSKPVILRPRRQVWCSLIQTEDFLLWTLMSVVGSFWKNTGYNFISFAPRLQYWLLRAVTWRRQLTEYWQTDCDHVNRMMQCSLRITREGAAAILCRYPSWINGLQTFIYWWSQEYYFLIWF